MSDDMSIIPERDEIRARQRTAPKKPSSGTSKQPSSQRKVPRADKSPSSSTGILTWMLCLFVVLLAGVTAYLYLETQTLAEERDALAGRVLDIESKLSVTDESLSQSGAAMQAVLQGHSEDLELHMSEIRKLWAVAYDRNRVSIETLQKDQKNTTARIDSMASSVASLDPIVKGYDGMQSRMETLASQLLVQSATLDDLSAQARDLADKTIAIDAVANGQDAAIQQHQEAIDAIDEYRIQINQRLLRLEQSLAPAGG